MRAKKKMDDYGNNRVKGKTQKNRESEEETVCVCVCVSVCESEPERVPLRQRTFLSLASATSGMGRAKIDCNEFSAKPTTAE